MDPDKFDLRLSDIESRLSAIEKSLGKSTPPAPAAPHLASPALRKSAEDFSDDFSGLAADIPASLPLAAEEEKPGNWLGIIATICFVLAAALIIKLSIESGWLTPARQIGLAALLGFGLIGTGLGLLNTDRAYAGLLPGSGIIVLYLTVFAAHRYYDLVSFDAALGFSGLVAALCVLLHNKIKHDAYPITAAIGTYIAPAVLGFHAEAAFSLYYFLICSVAFATLSIWMQSRALTLVSAYLAIVLTGIIGIDLNLDKFIATILALQFLVFAIGTYLYSYHTSRPLSDGEAFCFMPVLLSFYALEYYFIDRVQPGLAPWASLAFAAVLIGLYLSARRFLRNKIGHSGSLIAAFATVVFFHSVYLELMPEMMRPWLFPIIITGFALPIWESGAVAKHKQSLLLAPCLALLAILAIEYLSMLQHLVDHDYPSHWLAVSFASLASLWLAIISRADRRMRQENYGYALLGSAHLLAVLGLYRLADSAGSLAVSAVWLFYAITVIVVSFAREDRTMAQSALFVLIFAAAKALLYDAASAPTTIRILCLLLTGVVLYGCGLFMRQTATWRVDSDESLP